MALTFAQILHGSDLYSKENEGDYNENNFAHNLTKKTDVTFTHLRPMNGIIKKCLNDDHDQRPSLDQIRNEIYFWLIQACLFRNYLGFLRKKYESRII